MPILLALVGLAGLALVLFWFLRSNPSSLARSSRVVLAVLVTLALGGLLVLGMRLLPSLLPELMGLAGVTVTALIARWLRRQASSGASSGGAGGGFGTPGTGQRTETTTAYLRAWIDHGSGDVGGTVTAGRFAGRTLEALADSELLALHEECRADADSRTVLEAYLDRRLGAAWRAASGPPPGGSRGDMTREEALSALGLSEGATEDDVRAAHRRLIRRVHPDVGGSADLAARINRAKDILLGA